MVLPEFPPETAPAKPTRPDLVALKIYRDRVRGVSLLYPEGWQQFTFDTGNGPGVLFAPAARALTTHISLELLELPLAVRPDDLSALEAGFLAGLEQVAGSRIESHRAYDAGLLIGVEACQTFEEAETRRKRWVRLLYQNRRQARLVAQGATVAEFERWLVRFKPVMTTFNFGDVWPEP